ncbi:MAG TPA: IS91 family transposase [Gammaproteobacteria bacterium]|nr:IS91 family transposase [Gammaproteobacteria bacterium]
MERTSLQRIFSSHFEGYARTRKLPLKAHRAAQAIMTCRTAAQGGHIQRCPDNHEAHIQYHSCRHRSCPQCNGLHKVRWAARQYQRLLPVDHYHLIFTFPHELLPLWRYNVRWFAQTYFTVVRDTLFTLSKDQKYLGALPGFVISLHTWGRNLILHPHLHVLMTGGGLDAQGQWRACNNGYLFPSRVVRKLYKGKLLAALAEGLESGALQLPPDTEGIQILRRAARKTWHVRIQPPYRHGRGVMSYLARYIKGGPLKEHQVMMCDQGSVIYHYSDHRDGKRKTMRLGIPDFIGRILDHVAESRQHVIRHYGLYGHQKRELRNQCRSVLGLPEEESSSDMSWADYLEQSGKGDKVRCNHCGKRLVRGMTIGKKSILEGKGSGSGYVQQSVRADIETWILERTLPPRSSPSFFAESMPLN